MVEYTLLRMDPQGRDYSSEEPLVDKIIPHEAEVNLSCRHVQYYRPSCRVRDDVLAVINDLCGGLIQYIEKSKFQIDFSSTEWCQLCDILICIRKNLELSSPTAAKLFRILDENIPHGDEMEFHIRDIFVACANEPQDAIGHRVLPLLRAFIDDFRVEYFDSPLILHEKLDVCSSQMFRRCTFLISQDANKLFPKVTFKQAKKDKFSGAVVELLMSLMTAHDISLISQLMNGEHFKENDEHKDLYDTTHIMVDWIDGILNDQNLWNEYTDFCRRILHFCIENVDKIHVYHIYRFCCGITHPQTVNAGFKVWNCFFFSA